MQQTWDASLYAGNGRFVALLAESLVEALQPQAPANASSTWDAATASLPGGLPNQEQPWSESTAHRR